MKVRPTSKNRSLIARKYAGASRAAAMLGNLDVKYGEKKVQARSYSKKNTTRKKAMNTSESIYKQEKAEKKKPVSIFKEEGVVRATTSPDPVPKAEPAAPKARETTNARILRIVTAARERLRGRGMPELDAEIDELIEEIKGWPQG